MATKTPAQGRFVPGELIVMLSRNSDDAARVAAAGRHSPPDVESLRPISERLSKAADVPLRVSQIGSGETLLLGIDRNAVLDRVAAALREGGQLPVANVRRLDKRGPSGAASEPALEVSLERPVEDAQRYVAEQRQRSGIPIRAVATDERTLRVDVDWREYTQTVVKRLAAAPGVEHVEPNLLMRPMSAQPQG